MALNGFSSSRSLKKERAALVSAMKRLLATSYITSRRGLMKLEDLRNLYKNLNVTFKDDLTLKRAIIYYEVVKDAYTSLTSGPIKQELSKIVNGYERVAPALTHSTLLKGLCKILDRYTVPAVDQALKQANKTYKDYFTDLFQRYPASVETFLNTR